jgi:aspartate/methionine/tyrosine aminotransferase
MKIDPFQSERLLSIWQNQVEFDFTETGVHPLFLRELVSREELDEVYESVQLRYVQTNGPPPLKEAICGLYDSCEPQNILVTNGSAEANFLTTWHLVEPGDQVVVVLPNYLQVPGVARAFGAEVVPVHLRPETGWSLDIGELEAAIHPGTRFVYVANPNNPTGAVLSREEMDAIVAAAARVDAWLVADEVYRGAELDGEPSPSFWGRYEKTIVVAGLSKAYTLPGLRLGWLLAPPDLATTLWGYHDYTTITTNAVSERLGRLAMRPEIRARILERNRTISSRNLRGLSEWLAAHGETFSFVPPRIGGVAFVGYDLPIGSTELVMRLLEEHSVLVVPGEAFGAEHHLRIGYGNPRLLEGLALINGTIERLRADA